MHDSGAALAEPDDASLSGIDFGDGPSGAQRLQLPELLDPRLVRAELTRLRLPAQASRKVGLARARLARPQGTSDGGRSR